MHFLECKVPLPGQPLEPLVDGSVVSWLSPSAQPLSRLPQTVAPEPTVDTISRPSAEGAFPSGECRGLGELFISLLQCFSNSS
ncbi:hypothetical protein TNCT_228401 [Trichonephila clavata]|uniref:Uncharacterized protein n=1 Tax=Trichonephila clavata TaxID=2740835 RepID=A0A8X6G250_TRICU|nr:hypothetical protein TNCT_228401 [Trichonephila clavata]